MMRLSVDHYHGGHSKHPRETGHTKRVPEKNGHGYILKMHQTIGNRAVGNALQSMPVLQRVPSRIIPDLEDATVSSISSRVRHGMAAPIRQGIINEIVLDRTRKGQNFGIMHGNEPRYVPAYPQGSRVSPNANGVTIPANTPRFNPNNKPLVLIGPTAFGTSTNSLDERVVRIYSTIMHEYQHALQWQNSTQAQAMGSHRREVEAFFWEIENSRRTGLFNQRGPFLNTWQEALSHWNAFRRSTQWQGLSAREQRRYIDWHRRLNQIAVSVRSGPRPNP